MKLKLTLLLFIGTVLFGCNANQNKSSKFENPAPENSRYPYLYSTSDALFMSWLVKKENSSLLQYSRYDGNKWSAPHTIADDSTWFVNWADYPSIIGHKGEAIAAHWLNKTDGGPYAYNVNISTASAGDKWKPAIVPHLDNTATEHGFVSMVPWDETTILAVWLDGRQTAKRSENEYYDIDKAMTLRGAFITTDGEIKEQFLIDDAVCDCCQTSLTRTNQGAIVAYRNRTDDEIRDIQISRFDGTKWSTPQLVHQDNWKIGACPVNGPSVVADDEMVAVTWHTGAENEPKAKVAISTDPTKHFSKPLVLNKNRSIGRVDAVLHENQIYVSWVEQGPNHPTLELKTMNSSGEITSSRTIEEVKESRKTGFPRMEVFQDNLIFAWTKPDSAKTTVITKKVPLPIK